MNKILAMTALAALVACGDSTGPQTIPNDVDWTVDIARTAAPTAVRRSGSVTVSPGDTVVMLVTVNATVAGRPATPQELDAGPTAYLKFGDAAAQPLANSTETVDTFWVADEDASGAYIVTAEVFRVEADTIAYDADTFDVYVNSAPVGEKDNDFSNGIWYTKDNKAAIFYGDNTRDVQDIAFVNDMDGDTLTVTVSVNGSNGTDTLALSDTFELTTGERKMINPTGLSWTWDQVKQCAGAPWICTVTVTATDPYGGSKKLEWGDEVFVGGE